MRKFYAFLLAGVFVFVIAQNPLYAQEQQACGETISFINLFESPEDDTTFSSIKLEPKIDMLLSKAQAEDLSDGTVQEKSQDESATADNAGNGQPKNGTQEPAEQTAKKQKKHKHSRKTENTDTEQNAETAQAEGGTESAEAEQELAQAQPTRQKIGIDYPEDNALVQKFLKQYTTDYAKKWLVAVMKNGAPYRGYIRAKIAEMGLPECLEFLPVIESNFKIDAVSKSGAKGMWQFMKNSIAPFGIRINEWMDERCDPWLTTDAALKKLKENYDSLGDWSLALAAYNSGLGAVSRTCKKNPDSDYWFLCEKKLLKSESINYVPKFLAIADILTNPEYYGIEQVEFDETAHENYSFIEVKRNVDISLVAEQTSMDTETIKFLNPALFYGVTPPNTVYKLRIPSEYKDAVAELVSDKDKLLIKYYRYKIQSGDTLYALSRHYGVTEDMITQANPGLKPSKLKIGQTISIPAFKKVDEYKVKSANANVAYTGTYKVQPGDSLWGLSLKYNVQVESLAEANNMSVNQILREGSTLKVPIID